jgi:branched-chain amino acid transport system substrate-binding protein
LPETLRAAAAATDKPLKTYTNGYGVKFDDKMQNQRAIPNMVQWQGGKTVTVFPTEAAMAGTTLVNIPRAK